MKYIYLNLKLNIAMIEYDSEIQHHPKKFDTDNLIYILWPLRCLVFFLHAYWLTDTDERNLLVIEIWL